MSSRAPYISQEKGFFKKYFWRQFSKNKRAIVATAMLGFLLFIFVFADFLANDKPIVAKYNDEWMTPILKDYLIRLNISEADPQMQLINWKELEYDLVIWPLIPYGPQEQDIKNIKKGPQSKQSIQSWRWKHWFGTDVLGRDILSAMIHATRIDLSIGVIAMLFAALIGIFFGAMAGFFGDDQLKISRARLLLNTIFVFLAFFYAFYIRSHALSAAANESILLLIFQLFWSLFIFITIMILGNILTPLFEKINFLKKPVAIPLDITVSRLIEVIIAIPILFLIIMILAVVEGGSVFWVMVIIGLTRWTGIARLIRAELLKIRSLEYIESARSLGYSRTRILIKHAIPNAMGPVFIAIAFGIAGAILIEAFLSFIGIGVPPDVLTWGSLLNEGRESPRAWWLTLFPGIAIFITVTIFNLIGEGLTDALDPKQKS